MDFRCLVRIASDKRATRRKNGARIKENSQRPIDLATIECRLVARCVRLARGGGVMFAQSLRRVFVLSATCLCLGACAYATAIPVDYNSKKDGFRVYDLKPILVVNGEQISVEMIPNYNKAYAVQFGAFLAKQDLKLTLDRGAITSLDGTSDATAAVQLLQDIVKGVLPAATGKAMSGPIKGGLKDNFQVYEFVFADNGSLIGLRPLLDPLDKGRLIPIPTTSTAAPPAGGGGSAPQPPSG
jgi:hypothetical protein